MDGLMKEFPENDFLVAKILSREFASSEVPVITQMVSSISFFFFVMCVTLMSYVRPWWVMYECNELCMNVMSYVWIWWVIHESNEFSFFSTFQSFHIPSSIIQIISSINHSLYLTSLILRLILEFPMQWSMTHLLKFCGWCMWKFSSFSDLPIE